MRAHVLDVAGADPAPPPTSPSTMTANCRGAVNLTRWIICKPSSPQGYSKCRSRDSHPVWTDQQSKLPSPTPTTCQRFLTHDSL